MISAAEVKRRFSEVVERVARGERFVVTRHGRPVLGIVDAETASAGGKAAGVLTLMGALSGVRGAPDWAASVDEVVAQRATAADRPVPG